MYARIGDSVAGTVRDEHPGSDSEDLAAVLDDPHCRYLLEHLDSAEGPVAVSTLARHVVAGITDTPAEEVTDDVQRRVQTWLHHGQLPTLDEHDVVDFDPEAGEVTLGRAPRP